MKKPEPATPKAETGAPDALRWIAAQEQAARSRVEDCQRWLDQATQDVKLKPMEKDGEDWEGKRRAAESALDDSIARVQNWQKSLLQFDAKIDDTRRDATEKIPRDQVIQYIKMHAIYARQGTEKFANQFADRILECTSKEEVHKQTHAIFHECNLQAFDSAVRESHLPSFVKEAIESVL